jgi:hypothetical protein
MLRSLRCQRQRIGVTRCEVVGDAPSHCAGIGYLKLIFNTFGELEFPTERDCSLREDRKLLVLDGIWMETIPAIVRIDEAKCVRVPVIVTKAIRKIGIPRLLLARGEVCIERCLGKPISNGVVLHRDSDCGSRRRLLPLISYPLCSWHYCSEQRVIETGSDTKSPQRVLFLIVLSRFEPIPHWERKRTLNAFHNLSLH